MYNSSCFAYAFLSESLRGPRRLRLPGNELVVNAMFLKRHRERLLAIAAVLPICLLLIWMLPHAQTSFREDIPDGAQLAALEKETRQAKETAAAASLLAQELGEAQREMKELAEESLLGPEPYTYRSKALRDVLLRYAEPLETELETGPDADKLLEAGLLNEPGFEGEEAVSIPPFPPEKLAPPMPNMVIYESGYYPQGESGLIATWDGKLMPYTGVLRCSCTAYTTELQLNKITATGTVAHVGGVAVDPRVIPYGTEMYIVAEDGSWAYGYARAEDCGGGIKGNKIDLFMDTYNECIQFGVRPAYIYILG